MPAKLQSDYNDYPESASPSTPDTGYVRMYAKSDGNLYQKDDAGTETQLSGGGAGMTNFTVAGDSGTPQTIDDGNTLTIAGGTGLSSVASATDTITLNLDNTAVTPASYTNADITVDAQGRITAAANGTVALGSEVSGQLPIGNGGTGQSTQTAAMDALSPTTTKGDLLVDNGTNVIRLAVGTNTHVLTADSAEASGLKWAAASGGSGTPIKWAHIGDEKSSGTDGGSASATTWNARDLNTEWSDPDSIVTISSNKFTPIAGDFIMFAKAVYGSASAFGPGGKLRLYNVTAAAVVEIGIAVYHRNSTAHQIHTLDCYFTANGTDEYRIDHYATVAQTTTGLGDALGSSDVEIYMQIVLGLLP